MCGRRLKIKETALKTNKFRLLYSIEYEKKLFNVTKESSIIYFDFFLPEAKMLFAK